MTNKTVGTFYVGVTSNLLRRIWEHKNNVIDGFTSQHELHRLVWYQHYEDIQIAIAHEKRVKKWKRQWKINIIERMNPNWDDLYSQLA